MLNFLFRFYTSRKYFGDINISFQVEGALQEWRDEITGNSFSQLRIDPIENDYSVELIPTIKMGIIRTLFNPIFNGFGILDEELEDFYKGIESKLIE